MRENVPVSTLLPRLAKEVMGFQHPTFLSDWQAVGYGVVGTGIKMWRPLTDLNDAMPLLWAVGGALWHGEVWTKDKTVKHNGSIPSACRAIVLAVARTKSMILEDQEIDWER